jgi:hypothetical protein
MLTDDFMAYVGDFASGPVQYGQRVDMCSYLLSIMSPTKKPSDYWTEIIAAQKAKGNDPLGYDTRPGTPMTTQLIDPYNASRPWAY